MQRDTGPPRGIRTPPPHLQLLYSEHPETRETEPERGPQQSQASCRQALAGGPFGGWWEAEGGGGRKWHLEVQVADKAGDTETHEEEVGQGEGVDGVSELLDLAVARPGGLGGDSIPEEKKPSTDPTWMSLAAPWFSTRPRPLPLTVGAAGKAGKPFSPSVIPPTNPTSMAGGEGLPRMQVLRPHPRFRSLRSEAQESAGQMPRAFMMHAADGEAWWRKGSPPAALPPVYTAGPLTDQEAPLSGMIKSSVARREVSRLG